MNLRPETTAGKLARAIRGSGLALALVLGLGAPSASGADGIGAKLDAVLLRAGSVEAFLNDAKALDEYFLLLQGYYGAEDNAGNAKFTRRSFDQIVSVLKRTMETYPEHKAEFERRLMDATGLGDAFGFDVLEGGRGVKLDPANWAAVIEEWKDTLTKNSGPFAELEGREARIAEAIERLRAKADALGPMLGKPTPDQGKLFGEFRTNPEVAALASALTLDYLNRPDVVKTLASPNADEALYLVGRLRKTPGLVVEGRVDGNLKSLLGSRFIASAEKLEKRPGVMIPVNILSNQGADVPLGAIPAGKYEFSPIARRIHALWKGVTFKECIGGVCAPFKRPHLERIMTSALNGTQIYNLETNGKYRGFIQAVPVEKRGAKYGSVDFSAFPLRNFVTVKDPVTGKAKTALLFELWFEEAMRAKPADWRGFVVGTGRVVNNANVIEAIHNSPYFVFGKNVGPADSFHTGDPWQDLLPNLQARHGDARDIGGRMVFDAAMYGQGELTLLQPVSDDYVERFLADPVEVAEFFETIQNPARKSGLANLVATRRPHDAALQHVLVGELLRDRRPKIETWGDVLLRAEIQQSLMRMDITDPSVVERLAKGLTRHLDPDLAARIHVLLVSKFKGSVVAQAELARILRHPDSVVRNLAARTLLEMKVTDRNVLAMIHDQAANGGKRFGPIAAKVLAHYRLAARASCLEKLVSNASDAGGPP